MINKEFDFDKIGKRIPYTTPEGFFNNLEDDIWKEVKDDCQEKKNDKAVTIEQRQERSKSAKFHLFMRSVIAAAASIALVLVIHMNFFKSNNASSINDVDQAFCQLTTDDQAYLLSIYQDDVFINE